MAIDTAFKIGSGLVSYGKSLFGNNRESLRAKRDRIKNSLLSIGVNRGAWTKYNSDEWPAGQKLLDYLRSNPAAVSVFNRQFGKQINSANVNAFIQTADMQRTFNNKQPAMAAVSAGVPGFFSNTKNVLGILAAAGLTVGVYWYQNRKK